MTLSTAPIATKQTAQTGTSSPLNVDSIAAGLSFMLIANVIQRGIGFARNISFCRFLNEDQLGLWALASSFFVLGAPLAVLGLPGTLGRLVETYRVRGQLLTFLTRIFWASLGGTLVMSALLLIGHDWLGAWIFGVETSLVTMLLVVLTLGAVIAFNVGTELMNGLRRSKTASMMHSVNSISFTFLGLLLLVIWPSWQSAVVAFGLASLLGLWPMLRQRQSLVENLQESTEYLTHNEMWRRVIPFALSIWTMNLLINLFEVVDRYTLLNFAVTPEAGAALVGQFHSARILPVLLASLSGILCTMLLPYLAAEWEAGKHDRICAFLKLSVKGTSYFFYLISIGALVIAPMLFDHLLRGKYQDGLDAMPMALVYCCVSASSLLLQNYFWCAERGRIVGYTTAIGLVLNIELNLIWVPLYGIHGAMTATTIAGFGILLLTVLALHRVGIKLDKASYVMMVVPPTLLLGPIVSMLIASILFCCMSRSRLILDKEEQGALESAIIPVFQRFGFPIRSLWFLRQNP